MSFNDEEFGKNVIKNLFKQFIFPEIYSRQDEGLIEKPYNLRAAQILFFLDRRRPKILLNDEVHGLANIRLKKGIRKSKGDPITENEVEGLNGFDLLEEYKDCGHATMLRFNDTWSLYFDFRYNKGLSSKHIETAKEFFEAAKYSLDNSYYSSFIDNLFSCSELLAKSMLISLVSPNFVKISSHRAIHRRLNRFAYIGNVDQEFSELYNKLNGYRPRARYLKGDIDLDKEEADELLLKTQEMITYAEDHKGL